MMNNLRTRLILILLGGTIFSILVVGIITNVTLFNRFNKYMVDEQQNRIIEIVDYMEAIYNKSNQWRKEDLENLHTSPIIENFDLTLRNNTEEIIFVHYMEGDMMGSHIQWMGKMGHGIGGMGSMMSSMESEESYNTEKLQLKSQSQNTIGTLDMGYFGSFVISEREIEFTRGINTSIAYGVVISFIAAILLGTFFSKVISKPISHITKASNDIRHGKLDIRITETTRINELKELSYSINHLAASLKEQKELRKRLTSDVAHELRTPLTVLHSHIEAIFDGVWEPTQERLGIFKKEVERLMKMVEQLKNLTDIENEDIVLELESFNLSESVNEVIENFKSQFKDKNIELKYYVRENIDIKGDIDKIVQVMINLLSNAWKFTNSGGYVTVRMKELGEYVVIEVEDTGDGISKEDLPYVFERFYRGDKSRNRKTGGSGIGLTIAHKVVEAHHGTIAVTSELEKGTKFTVTLPKYFG